MINSRYRYVVAIGREGSFSAAATAMGVSQSAVTKSVADVEREVGYAIFYRTARGAIPTEDGRAFIESVARLMDDAKEVLRRPSDLEDPYASTLRIGVCPASLEWQVVEPLETMLRRHPGIRVDLTGASFERMVQQLRNGAVDVAVGFDAAFGGWPELGRKSLGDLESTLFVRKGHPLAGREHLAVRDLAEFEFVSPSDSKPYGAAIRDIYDSNGLDWQRKVHVVDYFPAMARIVRTSNAIGMVNRAYARSESFEQSFATIHHPDFFQPYPLCCAFRLRRDLSPAARAFIAAMKGSGKRLA